MLTTSDSSLRRVYRSMTRAELDAAYDNTAAVADSAEQLAGFEERSQRLAERLPEHLDLRCGPRERQRIDFFGTESSPSSSAPLLLFLHGGYWQMRRKETFRFLASGPLPHGICVALAGYTLAPEQDSERIRTGSSSQAGRRADISQPCWPRKPGWSEFLPSAESSIWNRSGSAS